MITSDLYVRAGVEDDAPATLRSFPVWVTLTAGADEACATLRLNVHARDAKGAIEAVRRALGETS
jgi:hypothetical protein